MNKEQRDFLAEMLVNIISETPNTPELHPLLLALAKVSDALAAAPGKREGV